MHIQVSGFSGGSEFVVCPFWKRFKYCRDSAVTWISTLKKQGTRPSTKICFNSEAASIGSILIGFMFPLEIVISRRFNQPTPLPKVRPHHSDGSPLVIAVMLAYPSTLPAGAVKLKERGISPAPMSLATSGQHPRPRSGFLAHRWAIFERSWEIRIKKHKKLEFI